MAETIAYNNRLQMSSIVDVRGTQIFNKSYGFYNSAGHNNGNVLSITDGLNSARSQTFTYDSLNRIATGAQSDTAFSVTYTIDSWGNMNESGTSNFTPLFDVTNRMHGWNYDLAGNLLADAAHSYTYDAENRIKRADSGADAYTYNPLGNRVRKDTASGSTEYFIFGGNAIAELNPATGAWTDYIFGGTRRYAKETSSNATGAQYYHADHLGSTRTMTDSTGTVISNCSYAPYGEEIGCSPSNTTTHYKFTGKERDGESGLDLMGARYYGNALGRFLRPDPNQTAGFEHMSDPQAWNGYSYVGNNPLKYVDPDGLSWHVCITARDGTQQCSDVSDPEFDQAKQKPGPGISLKNGNIYATVDGKQVKVGTYEQTDVDLNPFAQAVLTHPNLQRAAATMTDARTYALWTAASAVGGYALYDLGFFEGGLTTVEYSGAGEVLTNDVAGEIIGWGTGQEGVAVTEQLTSSLTREAVQEMVDKGLTKATVQRLAYLYERAIAEGGKKLANELLLPRFELMMRILDLWPK